MNKEMNTMPKEGDKLMCLHMEGETSVPPGTLGTVKKIVRDPFEDDDFLIEMRWENGSSLALVTSTDAWKIVNQKLEEQRQGDPVWNTITSNEDIFENFDWRWLEKFLYKLRDTGIVNMLGASPLLYAGSEHIDRYYGEGREYDEKFQEFLKQSDISKDKIIQGVVNYMIKHNKDLDNMDLVNSYAKKFSKEILTIYIVLSGLRNP
jgi:hypothetical protein